MKKALLWAVFLLLLPGNIFLAVNVCRRMFFYLAYTGGMPLVKGQEIQFFNPEFIIFADKKEPASGFCCITPGHILSLAAEKGDITTVNVTVPGKNELFWHCFTPETRYFSCNGATMIDHDGDWQFDTVSHRKSKKEYIVIDGKLREVLFMQNGFRTAVMPDNSLWLWQKDHWQKAEKKP